MQRKLKSSKFRPVVIWVVSFALFFSKLSLAQVQPSPVFLCTPNPSQQKSPQDDHAPETRVTVHIDNDNLFMGIPIAGEFIGNDFGYTHGLLLDYYRKENRHKAYGFQIVQQMHTKNDLSLGPERDAAYVEVALGRANSHQDLDVKRDYAVRYLDSTSIRFFFEKGDRWFVRYSLGTDVRRTNPTSLGTLPPGAQAQTNWHRLLGIYNFIYIPAEGRTGEMYVEDGVAKYRMSYRPDPQFESVARVSFQGALQGGVREVLFDGRCQVQTDVRVFVASEKKQVLGPNTHLAVAGEYQDRLLKDEKGRGRLYLGLSGQLLYFPKEAVGDPSSFGIQGAFEIRSVHYSRRKKNARVEPFMRFWLPSGRNLYSPANDQDWIHRMGVVWIFGDPVRTP